MSDADDDMKGLFNTRPKKEGLAAEDYDLVIDKKTGKIWVLHDKPFLNQDSARYAEYNAENHTVKFVSHDGSIQYLGAEVVTPMRPYLEKSKEITAILMEKDGNIKNMFAVPLKQKKGGEKV